jgi:glycosyltransferase involved in cell wall biosynthesis
MRILKCSRSLFCCCGWIEKLQVDAKLVVVGHKSDLVEQLAIKYADMMPNHLSFVGDVNASTIRNFLSHARALLLPSKYESFSYAILEAFASGVPVVVSNAVPTELVANGHNGFIVHSFDPLHYALKLSNLFNTPDESWNTFSENAIKKDSEFSYLKIAKKYEMLITRSQN